MKVITAPNVSFGDVKAGDVTVFLAGGITSCEDWQKEVIDYLGSKPDTEHLVIFNPRRPDWPDSSNYADIREQIEWEYDHLDICDIASFFFAAGGSVQPITMYEMGRQLARRSHDLKNVIVTVEEGYERETDVDIQSELAMGVVDVALIESDPIEHADRIYRQYKYLLKNRRAPYWHTNYVPIRRRNRYNDDEE